jgi:hypothetical protein
MTGCTGCQRKVVAICTSDDEMRNEDRRVAT